MSLSFDATYYQTTRPDVYNAFIATAGSTGLTWAQFAEQHYDTFGRFEGSDPHASFDTSFYLSQYPDVAAAGVNPFDHFLANGSLEDRQPYSTFPNAANGFDATAYKAANADLASLSDAAAYQHFVVHGQFEIAAGNRTSTGAPTVTPPTGTPGETFTLTTGPDAFTGSELDDTFIASNGTLGAADVLDGAGGNDLLRYASSGTTGTNESGFTASNIETVQVTADDTGGTTFDMTGVTGATTLNNSNSSSALTVTGLSSILTLGATNVSGGNTTVQYKDSVLTGTADAQTLNLTGNQSNASAAVSTISIGNSTSVGTAGLETLNIVTSGSASQLVDIVTGAATINISGDQALTVGNILDGATVINAGTSTGAVSVVADSAVNDVVVTGGTGDDTANFSASFDAGDSFDGGDGTDTLGLTNAVATGTPGGTSTNVEILNVTTAGTGTIDMDNFTGIGTVNYDAGLGGATIVDDAVTGLTVGVDVTAGGNNLTVDLKTDGTTDALTVAIDEVGTADALGTVNIDDAETANVSVDDDTTVTGTGTVTVANLSINDATSLNLSGNANLTIGAFTGPATDVLATVDASGMTGNLTVTGLGALLHNTASTITLGTGNDTINGGTGIGADAITLGTGTDTVFYTAANQSSAGLVDTIADFTSGTDVVDVTALLGGAPSSTNFVGNFGNFGAAQGALTGGATPSAVFDSSTNTLWVDTVGFGTLDANDLQVILTGVTSVTAADLGLSAGGVVNLTAAGAVVNGTTKTNADNTTTNGNDTINAAFAELANSTLDGLAGTDTLVIEDAVTGPFTLGTVAGATQTNMDNIENVTLSQGGTGLLTITQNEIVDVTVSANDSQVLLNNGATADVDFVGGAGTDQLTLDGVTYDAASSFDGNGAGDVLSFVTGTNTQAATVSEFETASIAAGANVSMTAAQHNAFTAFIGAAGAETINLSGAGNVTGNALIETYVLSNTNGQTFTVGTAGQNVTENTATTNVNVGSLALTGTFTSFDATDTFIATTGVNFTGANAGATLGSAGVGLNLTGNATMTDAQFAIFNDNLTATGTNALTVTDNNTALNETLDADIDSIDIQNDDGNTITLGAAGQSVDTGTGGDTVNINAFTATGTFASDGNDTFALTNGANISGATFTGIAAGDAFSVAAGATVTLSNTIYDQVETAGVTTSVAGNNSTFTFSDAAVGQADIAAIDHYNFAAGNNTFTLALANAATADRELNITSGTTDVITINNISIDAAGTSVAEITGFNVAADQIVSQLNGIATVTGAYTTANTAAQITGQTGGNVIEILSTGAGGVSIANPTNDASVLAALNSVLANGGTTADIADGNYNVIGYNGADAFIYQVTVAGGDGSNGGAGDIVELIGQVIGIGGDNFGAANIA